MAVITCDNDPEKQLCESATRQKASTNYAVALEKLGQRDEAIAMLQRLMGTKESRVFKNLGIIVRRSGDHEAAIKNY